jgi:hypothetical protein
LAHNAACFPLMRKLVLHFKACFCRETPRRTEHRSMAVDAYSASRDAFTFSAQVNVDYHWNAEYYPLAAAPLFHSHAARSLGGARSR